MKAVLKSVQPKWCELIASGKCTVLVCKTAPKLETPFKVFIYCTSVKSLTLNEYVHLHVSTGGLCDKWSGKVVGEFVCDKIYEIIPCGDSYSAEYYAPGNEGVSDCLTFDELFRYLGDKVGFGWHISDIKIYDKPKGLGEFRIPCRHSCWNCTNPLYDMGVCEERGTKRLICQPQSWMYVEEL